MSRIVAQLARGGLVNTFAGRDGGVSLPRHPSQITLKDVVELFEGPILLSECMQAKGEEDCLVRSRWGRVQAAMMREMASITFEDLAKEPPGIPMGAPGLE